MTCENCGIPPGAKNSPGETLQIIRPAENAFKGKRKSTVWVCCEECAIQATAVSKYGVATHKWPVTLSQFRTLYRRENERRTS